MNFQKRIALFVVVTLVASTCANYLTSCDSTCLSEFYKCFGKCKVAKTCTLCVDYKITCLNNCQATRKRREVYDAPAKITDIQGLKKYLNLQ
ncbi:Hypothetical predicted protein [Paramuricea clavata]|uniref:Uncharacterized protein n=1 Tax=Paramuricea clavata TaxID=317549 RepID=A0A6S7LJD5_PARCT|nr:Hypothetical predicted protein [Paramuricea clavata]